MSTTATPSLLSNAAAPVDCQCSPQPALTLEKPNLDWRKLVALGVGCDEAQAICERLQILNVSQAHYRLLFRAGIPLGDAKSMAWAIANFDVRGTKPTKKQRAKLCQYASLVCRANLWRSSWF